MKIRKWWIVTLIILLIVIGLVSCSSEMENSHLETGDEAIICEISWETDRVVYGNEEIINLIIEHDIKVEYTPRVVIEVSSDGNVTFEGGSEKFIRDVSITSGKTIVKIDPRESNAGLTVLNVDCLVYYEDEVNYTISRVLIPMFGFQNYTTIYEVVIKDISREKLEKYLRLGIITPQEFEILDSERGKLEMK